MKLRNFPITLIALLLLVIVPTMTIPAQTDLHEVFEDVPYITDGSSDQTVDIFVPGTDDSTRPTLFMIVAGDELIEYFVSRGYPVVVAAWRNEHYPTRMADLFCALAWTQSHAEDYGISRDIVAVGASMGGGYAALIAAVDDPERFMEDCPYRLPEGDRLRGVVAFSGTFDYALEDDFYRGFIGLVAERYVGGTPDELPEVWRDISAVSHIDGSEPPFLLLHGERDTNVDPHQSEVFASVLHEAGVGVAFKMIPRATHMSLISNEDAFSEMESFLGQLSTESVCPAQIIFSSNMDGQDDEFYLMNSDGGNLRRLTNNETNDWWPRTSPDGTQIAFYSDRGGSSDIYVMDVDGDNRRRLTDYAGNDWEPAWSPDGNQLVYTSVRQGNAAIFSMNADGSDPRQLTEHDAWSAWASWSPDGEQIAFASNLDGDFDVYVMAADGSNLHAITDNTTDDYVPSWSPGGLQIAYVAADEGENYEIHVISVDGSHSRQLTDDSAEDLSPVWSSDGIQIVFVSDRDGNKEIFVMDADGSNVRQLTFTEGRVDNETPAWMPVGWNCD